MGLRQTVAPASEPITAAEARAHMREDSTLQDTVIDGQIAAARGLVEDSTGRQLITATWKLTLPAFPCIIRLPRPPLATITTIKYYDQDGTLQTLSSSLYLVDTNEEPGTVTPAYGEVWPSTQYREAAVEVTYTAGYGTSSSAVPAIYKQAIKMTVAHWYENREAIITGTIAAELPLGVQRLLALGKHHRQDVSV